MSFEFVKYANKMMRKLVITMIDIVESGREQLTKRATKLAKRA